jgi:hypothetical protein
VILGCQRHGQAVPLEQGDVDQVVALVHGGQIGWVAFRVD